MGLPQQFKPDVSQADVVLGDEKGITDLNDFIPMNVGLPELFTPGIRALLQSHDLLEHEKGVGLVDPSVPVSVTKENGGDLDVVRLCTDQSPSIHREPDGIVTRSSVGVHRVLFRGGATIPENPGRSEE